MPARVKNSSTLSNDALSLIPGWIIGLIFSLMLPRFGALRTDSRVFIQSLLPRIVFISPLWAMYRNGCARLHVGNVLVEKREWTIAMALVKYGLVKSGK